MTGGSATAQFGDKGTVVGKVGPERQQLQLACDQGSAFSCYDLAENYYYGYPHRENHRALMDKACTLRLAKACARMAATYQYAVFVSQDLARSVSYYERVIQIDPNFPDAKKSLDQARAMLAQRDFDARQSPAVVNKRSAIPLSLSEQQTLRCFVAFTGAVSAALPASERLAIFPNMRLADLETKYRFYNNKSISESSNRIKKLLMMGVGEDEVMKMAYSRAADELLRRAKLPNFSIYVSQQAKGC
jgi:hypothetical protein